MDELMQKALDKHKIIRYIPTFVEVMTTYKSLLEEQNQALGKTDVMVSVCKHPIERRCYGHNFYQCGECGERVY